MNNSGLILTLAYPETVVRLSDEWFAPLLRYVGIGKKDYVRAGHAALVLISKETGILEYHDFGRYITPQGTGRVRGRDTDNELHMSLVAEIEKDTITNLDAILNFFATHPKITHGTGTLMVSVCDTIDYEKARTYIVMTLNRQFIPYAVFGKNASNCARFVTDVLIESTTNDTIKKRLIKSKWFTPSTVGNVLLANTEHVVYKVSETGAIEEYKGSQTNENIRCFLDRLKQFEPNSKGNLEPMSVEKLQAQAQWLSGIGSGAWFELHKTEHSRCYNYKRISPYGNIDVDAIFMVEDDSFDYDSEFEFMYNSNCKFFHVNQSERVYRFDRKV
ncbi:DUF6695 family protein [Changchengzhania lutea]|uniref:DUF6695 family protein n=1 Tax=Changchengzhania lutea TaxID=2049305 RepID=UPI00115E2535|nr:DUF6695 family protein [Changchengzhania lutea]